MSEQRTGVAPQAAPPPSAAKVAATPEGHNRFFIPTFWKFALAAAILMVLLALVGVGLTTTNSTLAPTYWVLLVPIYGLTCVFTALRRAAQGTHFESRLVLRQVLHWLGIAAALALDFLIRGSGEETGIAAGLNALLLLALGCYLAGIHFEWLFVLVGVLLTVVLVLVAKADQYLWLVFVIGGLAVAAMVGAWWLLDRHGRKGRMATATPAGR
jgi:hypothetical protein